MNESLDAFNAALAETRVENWGVQILLANGRRLPVAKSATQNQRVMQEQGAGWVQQTRAVFNLPVADPFRPELGSEWVISRTPIPADLATRWRCIELTPGATAAEHRCVCIRLDE